MLDQQLPTVEESIKNSVRLLRAAEDQLMNPAMMHELRELGCAWLEVAAFQEDRDLDA